MFILFLLIKGKKKQIKEATYGIKINKYFQILFITDNTVQQTKCSSGNLSNKILFGDSEVDTYAKFKQTGMFEHNCFLFKKI